MPPRFTLHVGETMRAQHHQQACVGGAPTIRAAAVAACILAVAAACSSDATAPSSARPPQAVRSDYQPCNPTCETVVVTAPSIDYRDLQ